MQDPSEEGSELMSNKELVIVDVWADWCGPCKRFAPIFEKLAQEYTDIQFVKVNADEAPEFLDRWSIRGIPTIMVFENQQPIFSHAGILSEPAMRDLISRVQNRE